jgi:hypothetical protein
MKRLLIITVLAGMVIGLSLLPVCASLTPMAWGMPIMAGGNSLTSFYNDAAVATDNEAASVAFPTTGLGCGCGIGTALPSIAQTALQSQSLSSVGLTNANQNYFFAYPYLSIGGAPIPSMGFF